MCVLYFNNQLLFSEAETQLSAMIEMMKSLFWQNKIEDWLLWGVHYVSGWFICCMCVIMVEIFAGSS